MSVPRVTDYSTNSLGVPAVTQANVRLENNSSRKRNATMKKTIIFIMLAVILFPISSYAKNVIFDDSVIGFKMVVPDNWSIQYPPGRGRKNSPALIATSPDTSGSNPFTENLHVMIGKQPTEVDINVLMKESVLGDKGMKSVVKKYKVHTVNKDVINGMPAVWKTVSFVHPEFNKIGKQLSVMIGYKKICIYSHFFYSSTRI